MHHLAVISDELKMMGVAANQLGFTQRVIVLRSPRLSQVMINPKIVHQSGSLSLKEGCFSVPLIGDDMPVIIRFEKILLHYQDSNMVHHEFEYEGFPAAIIQHEIDHLDGILMIDLATAEWKRKHKKHLRDIKNGHIEPTYESVIVKKGKTVVQFKKSSIL